MKNLSDKQNRVLHIVGWVLLSAILALEITILAVAVQPNSFRDMLSRFLRQPMLLMLNFLPVFLLVITFGALFHSAFLGGALVNLVLCGMSIASRIKFETRDEALLPRDFLLLREVGEAVGSYDITFPWKVIAVVLGVTLLLILAGIIAKKQYPRRGHWLRRVLTAVLSLGALVGLTLTVYSSDEVYYSFECTNSYYEARTYNEYGMPYSFFHNFTTNLVDMPEGYDKETAREWDNGAENPDGPQVHLIMIMSEAFTDLSDEGMFSWAEETDPLKFFHSLQQNEHALTGRVVVPNFGGGTANTEFDVLTGMQKDALASATTTAFTAVSRNLDSLFRVYNGAGYVTGFIHPGYTWFYNRQNAFSRLGAQSALFYEDMDDKVMKGTWVTDDYIADRIIGAFETAVSQGEILYNYTTTVQNHMAYTKDKYGEDYVYPAVESTMALSETTQELLSVYFEGIRDADRSLEKLVSYFEGCQEPVVLAFWGDHYPNLGGSLSVYNELGLIENQQYPFRYYATPYVIWANDAAAEVLSWDETVNDLDLPENGYLSSCFLGSTLLELCGRGEATAWNSFLNQLRREIPVVWNNECYFDGEGNLLYELSDEQQALISKWRCWGYYKLTEKEISD